MKTPTIEQFGAYQAAFDYFNRKLFANALKPCLLNFRGGSKRTMGLFWAEKWSGKGGKTTHEIALNPDVLHRPLMETMSTLVHEMVHQWQQDFGKAPRRCYHDRQWALKMEAVGLMPSNTGEPGGKKTGQQMTHYVVKGGAFDVAFRAMPDAVTLPWLSGGVPGDEPAAKPKNKVKYLCPCDNAVWGKSGLAIVCGECGEEFEEQG